MSNLSDLLPAGAGAKSATFTASGTLATGQAVALKSDGTVTSITGLVGTATVFEEASINSPATIYDINADKIVVFYSDLGNSNYLTAAVGTVSGTSITFGTPVVGNSDNSQFVSAAYDSSSQKIAVSYRGTSSQPKARMATTSGTSVSFGAEATVQAITGADTKVIYDSNANKIVVGYKNQSNARFDAKVGTVSGTSISFGSAATVASVSIEYLGGTFDSSNNKVVFVYADYSNTGKATAAVGTVSGTSISFGTPVVYENSNYSVDNQATFDTSNNKVIANFRDNADGNKGNLIVGTVSGTSISFGSPAIYSNNASYYGNVSFDSVSGKTVVTWKDNDDGGKLKFTRASVSGTSITYETEKDISSGNTTHNSPQVYQSQTFVVSYRDDANSNYGTSNVVNPLGIPNTDFVGITDEAIANAATGSVVVEGGVITNSTLVPDVPSVTAGSVGLTSDDGRHMGAAYDASADRVVAAYQDVNNSYYGTAAVGTVSGTSISFGTPVVFQSANVNQCKVAYDSTNELTFIAYNNNASSRGTARYGAVSGTTIDFSVYNPVVFNSSGSFDLAVAHDSNAGKMVVAYYDNGNSGKGTAVVGSLSGFNLTFGTAVVYNSGGASNKNSMAYDANAQKVVITYADAGNSNYPTSIVGTVSGTSISFGSETVIANVTGSYTTTTYDSTNQKIIVAYQDGSDSNAGKAAVGTVSGTSITFGTPVAFAESLAVNAWLSSAYDSNNGVVVFNFKNNSGNAGTCLPAVVDGTSFSYGSSVVFESGSTEYTNTVYDTTAQKFVVVYNDGGGGDLGSAVVLSPSVTTGLTTGSTYYVQNDGSLSTTSSSVTAGKALSSTTLLLKG